MALKIASTRAVIWRMTCLSRARARVWVWIG